MTENKQIIKNVYDMIIKFKNIEGNQYDMTSFNFRDILSREKFGFEYNFIPFMFDNLELFKKYLDNVLTLDQLKIAIKENGWPDITINGKLDNLHKVTLTYDKLYEICFTKPNKVESAIECYAMIGSKEPIIKWLKDEGVKTKEEARAKLEPIKGGIALGTFLSGSKSSSTFDYSSSFLDRIVATFE